MKTKKSTRLKLAAYSSLSSAFIALGSEADAQIFYTDIIPDVVLDENGEFYDLDLNFDGMNEIEISKVFFSFSSSSLLNSSSQALPGIAQINHVYAEPFGSNAIAGISDTVYGFFAYPFAMEEAELISASNNWLTESTQSIVYSFKYQFDSGGAFQVNADGEWFGGKTDYYLGIKFISSGNTYYGWLRMDVSADNKIVTIKDFAFDGLAGDAILAGEPNIDVPIDTSDIAIDESMESQINSYSYGNTLYLQILDASVLGSAFEIYSMQGALVNEGIINENNLEIPLLQSPAGVYVLQVRGSEKRFSKSFQINN